jgi:hypothetical protein
MLTYDQKIWISIISGAIWIYFREGKHYIMLPRKDIASVILVCLWIYINYKEPLALPFGLVMLYMYGEMTKDKKIEFPIRE